jgi:hypothetical protein
VCVCGGVVFSLGHLMVTGFWTSDGPIGHGHLMVSGCLGHLMVSGYWTSNGHSGLGHLMVSGMVHGHLMVPQATDI